MPCLFMPTQLGFRIGSSDPLAGYLRCFRSSRIVQLVSHSIPGTFAGKVFCCALQVLDRRERRLLQRGYTVGGLCQGAEPFCVLMNYMATTFF